MTEHSSADSAAELIARADKYLNTGSGEYASDIMRDMAEFIRRLPSTPAQAAQDEIENYRLALAWIEGQSSDPKARELAATALELKRPDVPQAAPVIAEPANKPAIDPKKIKAIDQFLADGERDKGYRAFAMMRQIWPQLRGLALASSQLDEDAK